MRRTMLLLAAAVAILPAAAPAPAPPKWAVVQPGSRLGFAASMNGAEFGGSFARWTAQIRFDPNNLPASAAVVRVATASARTGDATRDEALPTDDWFAVRAFPVATYRTTRIRALGTGRYMADGQLTIRGASRAVALPFALAIQGDRATMRGSLSIDRTLFAVGGGQFAGDEPVLRRVRIDIALTVRKQS